MTRREREKVVRVIEAAQSWRHADRIERCNEKENRGGGAEKAAEIWKIAGQR
jgi:hypothetical protein